MTHRLVPAIALAAFIITAALGLSYAEGAGWVGEEGGRRIMQVLIGLMLAAYANMMPKQLARPNSSPRAEVATQSVLRVGGWSLALAGLVYAGLWTLAPLDIADIGSMVVLGGATAFMLGYAVWTFAACRRAAGGSTSA
ncbi:hypothetical protein GGQ87_000278 [Brevundimonas alba]|uniref:Ammonium transporter n=1 Tax=Brevundimonas alba TaxID=74314 RepID=A0A7X5YHE5_9CAUL|nr:hypothetical protein [Brevundimonas alba]NJC40020.1 hypothetical protein [Brevundimonas alba]